MNKKGFTLIEILGVIVILSLLIVLAFPKIVENIKKSEDEISKATMSLFSNAADLYIDNNKAVYNKQIGDVYCIEFEDLIAGGYLKAPIIDTTTGKELEDVDEKIIMVEISQPNTYEVVTNCTEINN